MKVTDIFIESLNDSFYLEKIGAEYSSNGINVRIEENGNVFIKGKNKNVSYLKIKFDVDLTRFIVLGDAWERAYGELCWEKTHSNKIMPWYFVAYDYEKVYGFGVKTQPNALCSWKCVDNEIMLIMDLRNGSSPISLQEDYFEVCSIVTGEYYGDIYDAIRAFCSKMCENPISPERPVFGGNDWYCCYGDNSFSKVVEHTKKIVECSQGLEYKPYMVIDDGWEICHHQSEKDYEYYNGGPWKYCNMNFNDMKYMAETIKNMGAIPGIWFRPLWTVEKFPEEYYLKHDGVKYTLDPSVPEVLEQIKSDIVCLKNWGYRLIKHDFTTFDIFGKWGFELEQAEKINFHDKTKTTAQIIKNFYNVIREAAGDEVVVMGCNTLSHLSAGIFDIQRTGDDTSGIDWERTKKYGINTLAFRMPQHKTFYCVDADCVGITPSISWDKNKMWLDVLAKSGTPLFVSIAEDMPWADIKNDIANAFKMTCENEQTSKPLDWFESKIPQKWESVYGIDKYVW